jgi:hypothetical protein
METLENFLPHRGALVIRNVGHSPEWVRVVGALQGPPLRILLKILGGARIVLDLSEVREAEADAVRLVAELPSEKYELLDCPRWLTPWIERERQLLGSSLASLGGGA